MSWTYDTVVNPEYGVFAVKARRGQQSADISWFRDVPAIIENLTFADPFGDATALLRFPQITGFEGPYADPPANTIPTDIWWLKEFTDIDVYYLPATATEWHDGERLVLNPMSQKMDLYLHERKQDGSALDPLWEGFIVSIEPSLEGVQVQCQGCLYQLDYYYAKPLNPLRPRTVENIISKYMHEAYRGLHFKPLIIDWPADWTKYYLAGDKQHFEEMGDRYIPLGSLHGEFHPELGSSGELPVGSKWTGFVTRNYGSWEKILTGYIQGQLSYMFATPDGVNQLVRGDQWTITKRGSRQPRMRVRRKSNPPTVVAWYGQPGVEARLTRDGSQVVNIFYGDGKGANQSGDVQWNLWRQPLPEAAWSIWQPLAAPEAQDTEPHQSWLNPAPPYQGPSTGYGLYHFFDKGAGYPGADPLVSGDIWPVQDSDSNRDISRLPDAYDAAYEKYYGYWISEKQVTFPDGIDEGTAREIAYNWLENDKDPGWQGTIELKTDLRAPNGTIVSKWSLRDGDIVLLKGFQGQETETVTINKFHVSQVSMNPMEGTVTLTVDTKFRDLLTTEEAIARGRDSLAPVKSLQVNRRSQLLNDLIIPWNPRQGSGYFPRQARALPIYADAFPHSFEDGSGTLQQPGNTPRDIFTQPYLTGNGYPIGKYAGNDNALESPKPASMSGRPYYYDQQIVQTGKEALYVPVHSGDPDPLNRWAIHPILLSQAGTIMRSEFAVYDLDGNLVPVEFHVSIYPVPWVSFDSMPWNGEQGALATGAFQEYKADGFKYTQVGEEATMPTPYAPIIGWGSGDQPAGYSPKKKIDTSNAPPTGLLIDGAPWTYNFLGTSIPETDPSKKWIKDMGNQIVSAACVVWVSQTSQEWTYVRGRVYRGVEGA